MKNAPTSTAPQPTTAPQFIIQLRKACDDVGHIAPPPAPPASSVHDATLAGIAVCKCMRSFDKRHRQGLANESIACLDMVHRLDGDNKRPDWTTTWVTFQETPVSEWKKIQWEPQLRCLLRDFALLVKNVPGLDPMWISGRLPRIEFVLCAVLIMDIQTSGDKPPTSKDIWSTDAWLMAYIEQFYVERYPAILAQHVQACNTFPDCIFDPPK